MQDPSSHKSTSVRDTRLKRSRTRREKRDGDGDAHGEAEMRRAGACCVVECWWCNCHRAATQVTRAKPKEAMVAMPTDGGKAAGDREERWSVV
eukprot:1031489-Prymnesium_polylepis.1